MSMAPVGLDAFVSFYRFCFIMFFSAISNPNLINPESYTYKVESNLNQVNTLTLPKTNIASENGWLEYDRFLLGRGYFPMSC